MAERRQLPPQIRRVELARRSGGKPVVRYQLTVDTGLLDGKRKQLRRRYATEKEARAALAEIQGQVAAGRYVHPSKLTVEQACADWLLSRHQVKPTTAPATSTSCSPCAASSARSLFKASLAATSTTSFSSCAPVACDAATVRKGSSGARDRATTWWVHYRKSLTNSSPKAA